VLLGAVVQVALDPSPFGVAARDDARARGAQFVGLAAQLVERTLQRGVELGVVHRQSHLAGELGQHPVVLLAKDDGPFGAGHDDDAEQLAGVADRRDAQRTDRPTGDDRRGSTPRPRRCPRRRRARSPHARRD
jgi:hypothetical protein